MQSRAVTAPVPLSPQGVQLCPGAQAGRVTRAGRASQNQGNPFPQSEKDAQAVQLSSTSLSGCCSLTPLITHRQAPAKPTPFLTGFNSPAQTGGTANEGMTA